MGVAEADHVHHRAPPLALNDLLKRDLKEWSALCQSVLGADCLTLSARQVMSQPAGSSDGANPYLRSEHTCSTSALMLLLVWAQRHRRKKSERSRVAALVSSLLHRFAPPAVQSAGLRRCPTVASGRCDRQPVVDGLCFCLRSASERRGGIASDPGRFVLDRVKELIVFVGCPAVLHWLRSQLVAFQEAFDQSVINLQDCDDPLKSKAVPAGQKRNRRIGEDWKAAPFKTVQEGRSHSVDTLQSALADPRGGGVNNWIHERL